MSRSLRLFASSFLLFGIVPAARASSVQVLSTPAFLEPSTGKTPSDKDAQNPPVGCLIGSSNADPEEASLQAKILVTATVTSPNLLIAESSESRTSTGGILTVDDPTTGPASSAGVVRDLDYLDGVIDGKLAASATPYYAYFNLDKTGYTQGATLATSSGCAGNSLTGNTDTFTATLRSGTTNVSGASGSLLTTMQGSAGAKQNDLDWLDTVADSTSLTVGSELCIRSKYRQSSAQGLYELIGNAFYNADILRLDSVDLYYYDTNGADPGSLATGIPGVDGTAGTTPETSFHDQIYFGATTLSTLGNGGSDLSSGDHWVSNFCFTVVGTGSTFFAPYWTTRASSTSNYKVDSGFGNTTILTPAQLTIEKVCDATESLVAGVETELTDTLEVCNTGAGGATDVVVSDDLPDDVTCVSATDGGTCDNMAHTVDWDVGTLAAGACVDLDFVVSVTPDGSTATVDTNVQASVTGTSSSGGTTTADSTDETCPYDVLVPDFSIEKSADAAVYAPGDTVTYTVTVTNDGDVDLENVLVTDDIDETKFSTVDNISDGGSYGAGLITWNLGTILVGESVSLTYQAVLNTAGFDAADCESTFNDVINLATVTTDFGDDSDGETICVAAAPVLVITKAATGSQGVVVNVDNSASVDSNETSPVSDAADTVAAVGATDVFYTITVENTGNAPASGIVVTDVLQGVSFQTATPSPTTNVGGTLTWSLASPLAVGGSTTIDLTVRAE